jgi:hypothetical protein
MYQLYLSYPYTPSLANWFYAGNHAWHELQLRPPPPEPYFSGPREPVTGVGQLAKFSNLKILQVFTVELVIPQLLLLLSRI